MLINKVNKPGHLVFNFMDDCDGCEDCIRLEGFRTITEDAGEYMEIRCCDDPRYNGGKKCPKEVENG